MLINTHVHVNTDNRYFFYPQYTLQALLEDVKHNSISMAFPCLNPKLDVYLCPNDCAHFCKARKDHHLELCTSCKKKERHRTKTNPKVPNMLCIVCTTCKTELYQGKDPLRIYNEQLLEQTMPYRSQIKPLLFLSGIETTIQEEIDYFETHYKGEFVGYKLHPWTHQASCANLRVHTHMPFLIHTGVRDLESSQNAISFAKNNPQVSTILAHAGQLQPFILKQIASLPNTYIDCCPASFLFAHRTECLSTSLGEIHSPQDIYYMVLEQVPSNKILFGTDTPWGNIQEEVSIFHSLHLPEHIKKEIAYQTAMHLFLDSI